jgi:signal transduction histidine kinase
MRTLLFSAVAALSLVTASIAQDTGTAEEAQAMLERAVAAIEADQAGTLAAITAGDPQFREKDLYVFCAGEDGTTTAHGANASMVGQSLREMKDKAGEPFGERLYAAGVEGEMNTVEYMWPKPGETEPSEKVSYVTKVEGQVCGVGYYK